MRIAVGGAVCIMCHRKTPPRSFHVSWLTHVLAGLPLAPWNQRRVLRNGVDDIILASIVDSLAKNATLAALSFRDNAINDGGCKFLADLLRKNRTLVDLS